MKGCFAIQFWCVLLMVPLQCNADEISEQFFETQVRPILVQQCNGCHGPQKQSGDLRVDSREALIQGGASGPAVVPGNAPESLLFHAIKRSGDLAMPPNRPMNAAAIRVLEQWINMGADWPMSEQNPSPVPADRAAEHWAFVPVIRPPVPTPPLREPALQPIDAFVATTLAENDLVASPQADRASLIRRVTYALTGLPPSIDAVNQFVADPSADAYEALVDRLLDSPQYGEHWARHWLDVARYSDTKGYVYAREERFWTHAWTYRDWVVQTLNDDMPYNRFVLMQLAADQVQDRSPMDLAAMGFLTLGRRFLGVERDIIDDRIDVVCRGTMGLTVACARCHDHKYDPIPTADYYALYGVMDSCAEKLVSLDTAKVENAFTAELQKRQTELEEALSSARKESAQRARERIADYLFAQSELDKYPANGFDQIFSKQDLLPAFVRCWEQYLWDAKRNGDPVFDAWLRFHEIAGESFAAQAGDVTRQIQTAPEHQILPIVASLFQQPPESFREVCDRYGELFADLQRERETVSLDSPAQVDQPASGFTDKAREALQEVLYGPHSPCQVPEGPITESETFFDSGTCTSLWKLQGQVDRWIIDSERPIPFAVTLSDNDQPAEPRVFRRGNPLDQRERVPRQFLAVLAGGQRTPFQKGSGRLELAEAIIDPENPLTARVIVNRVWAHHFGRGLVATPSDFGTRAAEPSHPELLDWLASEFIAQGWSLKQLHRNILRSMTYRQSTLGPTDHDALAMALRTDPENRLLWRANTRRLSFEEIRDSMLAVTDELDRTIGGKPTNLFQQPFPRRRTLYGLVDRQYLPGTLRLFDFASPDLHVPQRSETTVPQQALFFMNHPMVLDRVRALAKSIGHLDQPNQRVDALFERVFQRRPTDAERRDAIALVKAATTVEAGDVERATADWKYGYGAIDEQTGRTIGFTALPHFTGDAWQGGSNWPDSKLGWVQLTARGGHPGNDRRHASVRRWTASGDMTVRIASKLIHEPTAGDGIRAFVVSSHSGVQQTVTVHHDSRDINVDLLRVAKGETIDFVVDIDEVLNSDQYLWEVTLHDISDTVETRQWNSVADFPANAAQRLNGWEQLAQVLLCSNEFMFID